MADEKKQVNVEMDAELVDFIDELVEEDESTRSAVIRKLIRQEKARRQQLPLPFPKEPKRRKTDHRAARAVAA